MNNLNNNINSKISLKKGDIIFTLPHTDFRESPLELFDSAAFYIYSHKETLPSSRNTVSYNIDFSTFLVLRNYMGNNNIDEERIDINIDANEYLELERNNNNNSNNSFIKSNNYYVIIRLNKIINTVSNTKNKIKNEVRTFLSKHYDTDDLNSIMNSDELDRLLDETTSKTISLLKTKNQLAMNRVTPKRTALGTPNIRPPSLVNRIGNDATIGVMKKVYNTLGNPTGGRKTNKNKGKNIKKSTRKNKNKGTRKNKNKRC